MTLLVIGLILVPLIDQTLKFLVLHRLGGESISLGLLGRVTSVRTRIWMARAPYQLRLVTLWTLWIAGASTLVIVYAVFPASGWFCALLLGGSLSHALEMSVRGSICDYVCLRFWPAFNLADLAITAGAIGLVASLTKFIANTIGGTFV